MGKLYLFYLKKPEAAHAVRLLLGLSRPWRRYYLQPYVTESVHSRRLIARMNVSDI